MDSSIRTARFDTIDGRSEYLSPDLVIRFQENTPNTYDGRFDPAVFSPTLYLLPTAQSVEKCGGRWVACEARTSLREISPDDAAKWFSRHPSWYRFTPSDVPGFIPLQEVGRDAPRDLIRYLNGRSSDKWGESVEPMPSGKPRIVRFGRLDGFGSDTVDLHACRRYLTGVRKSADGSSGFREDTVTAYYMMPDGRYLMGPGGYEGLKVGAEGFHEIHPVIVAHALLIYDLALPPELEAFRHGASEGYHEWLGRQGAGIPGSNEARAKTVEEQCQERLKRARLNRIAPEAQVPTLEVMKSTSNALRGYPVTFRRRKIQPRQDLRSLDRRRSMPRCVSPTPPT